LCATYLINRLPSVKLNNRSPLEILYQRKINLVHLRVFGCVAFVKIKRKSKLDFISTKAIFLGYSSVTKGYKCYDPIQKNVFISRDVNFFENESYFKKQDITQESYTIDHNSTVLPQPLDFGNVKNVGNLKNLEDDAHEDNE
jgi:hypothetical protein